MYNATKAVLKGTFIALNTYIRKKEKSQINNLSLYLRKLEKEDKIKQNKWKEENKTDSRTQ